MQQKKKILFVDDEPLILKGLRRSLYHKNDSWEIFFANSGEEALKLLEKDKFKVIVTDMFIPRMDGATLLKKVQDLYPETIRIILSGKTDIEMVKRTVSVAHQFLIKPCSTSYLEEIIDRSCYLQDSLQNENIKKIVGKIDKLPVLPKTHQELVNALSNPHITFDKMASIFEQDMAMSAKLLQIVNSAFFSLPYKTTSIARAVGYLGMDLVKDVAFSEGVYNIFKNNKNIEQHALEQLQMHAMLCANIAKSILEDPHKANEAFLSGMLHDIGHLLLLAHFPDEYKNIMTRSQLEMKPRYLIEKEVFGVTHAEIGGYLLGIWGIPFSVVEAVTYHHEPSKVLHKEFDVLSAVYIANQLLEGEVAYTAMDMEYLEELGVHHLLPEWQVLTQAMQLKQSAAQF